MHDMLEIHDGDGFWLEPAGSRHVERLVAAMNAEQTRNLQFFQQPPTFEREAEYLGRMVESPLDALYVIFNSEGTLIGTVGLHEIDFYHRTARFGILILRVEDRGRGYGTGAIQTLLKHAFTTLRLNKIYGKVFADNPRNIGLYTKLGFLHEGGLREEYLLNGVFHNMVYISMLRTDWDRLQAEKGTK